MRRTKPEKRDVNPDVRYHSILVSFLINRILKRGKKSTATTLVYNAMDIMAAKTGKEPLEVLDQALKNVGPMEVATSRKLTLAMRWILAASRSRTGKSFAEKLSAEILDAANNQGAAVRKREETHKMAEANRAFSHYRL
jgi:small subunit ribosomal protein S7